ncbi:MAG TPA: urate hydroxylase PuuD [Thermoanaerobaculia bacterium]|nr:urate hydroxylase PuuD [Thermoanaerobaculia bacterium]
MNFDVREWLNLAFRWTHVFAAIMWVGQTYFFTWLDHAFHGEKQVWMVHSGGFYIVDKQKRPELLNQTLHWFKWEAFFTLLSGFALLILVYYDGRIMVDEDVFKMTAWQAAGLSVALIAAGWFLYDLLWISPLRKHEAAGTIVSYLLLAAAIFGATRLFAARAAYMQIGATLGSFMALNVWVRILPAQRALIAAVKAGIEPDMRLADLAKQRSKQNTFIVLPVVLIMISNHFPVATYSNQYNWLVLSALVLVGWGVAAVIRTR